uniref:Uncharacterized protein n=1 Tax=Amphiprion ocellaris TaxID=80972 RepID=A0AAQ5XMN3_AMPOC
MFNFSSQLLIVKSLTLPVLSDGGLTGPRAALEPEPANEFLRRLRRTRRNIWDRSRPDVQQWIQQFMSLGYDEAVRS